MKKFFANIVYDFKHNNYAGWIVPTVMCVLSMAALFMIIVWLSNHDVI